jgi:outer membrane autotransporter protein
MKIQRSKILMQSIVALLALTATHRQAQAGQVWDGGGADGLWSNPLNWEGNTLPSFGVPLQFDGALQLTSINNLTATVSGVTFNSGADAFTLTGSGVGDSVTLNGGILNSSLNLQTVAFGAITLGSDQTFMAEAALTVSSAIQLGANTLTVDTVGGGNIVLDRDISGTGGLMKTGDGVLTLSGVNTQNGPTLILTGVVAIGLGESLSPNSDVTIEGGILDLVGNSPTIGALKDGGSSNGKLTNSTASAVVLTLGNNNGTGSFSGLIEDGGTGGVGLAKVGSGSQTLSGANTYTGPTTVNGGALIAGVASVSGFSGAFGVNSAVTLGNVAGAMMDITGFDTQIGSLTGGGLLGGNIILGAAILTVGGDGTSPGAPFGGVLIGTGGLLKIGSGTLGLSGANLYSGATTIDEGTLQSGAANSFSANSEISLSLGGVLDLAGHSNVIKGLNGLGGTVTNSGSASVNFTVGSAGGSGTFAGVIEDGVGPLSVIKVGSGAQTFSGENTYGGGTALQSGQLFAEKDTALGTGPLTMSGGTTFGSSTGERTLANPLTLTSPTGSFTLSANTKLNFTGDVTLANGTNTISGLTAKAEIKFTGAIGGSGSVTYNSPVDYTAFIIGNALDSDVANTYTGLTTVNDNVYLVLNKGGGGNKAILGDVVQNGTGSLDFFLPDQISDTASVTINGPGNLLDGNLYAGLQLNNHNETIGSLLGASTGKVQLGSAILTVGAGNFPGTIADGFSGVGGQLVKNTSGVLTLSGANTYTGNTSVNNGQLVLNGSVESPNIFVNFFGRLSGTGTAMHNVRNAGVFSPGNSPGTFRIRGNYTQTGAGTMVIETTGTSTGSNDLVQVAGSATLDGSLRLVKVGSAVLKVGDKATFLTAGGGVSGKFANVTNGLADTGTIVQTEVVYGSNSVELLAVQGSYELFAQQFFLTPNQLAVAGMLDVVAASASQPGLIDYLNAQALADLPGDFDLIAPDELQAIYTIGMSQANVQTANLQRRMEGIRAGREGFSAEGLSVSGTTPPFLADARPGSSGDAGPPEVVSKEVRAPSERRLNTFVTGSGEYSRVGESGGSNGYNLTTGGFTLGVDYKFSEHFSAGINTGFARTTSKGLDSTKVTVDGAKLGAYGTYYTGEGFYADGSIQGGYSNYDTQRTGLLGTARGTTNGAEVNALIATGFDFTTDALRIGPVASFQYTHVGFANYQESGSLAPLDYGSQSANSMRSAIGMKATYEYRTHGILIRPEMRAAWQHEFGDVQYAISSSLVGGGPAFIVQGAEIGRESLLLGVGVSVLWNERASTYLYYDGELGRTNYSSNNISGGVRLEF